MQATPTTFTVDRSDDPADVAAASAGECTATANDCSLRGAIFAANSNNNPLEQDTINFNIPGSGVKQINLTGGLNEISESLSIEGYTQTGASVNTITDPRNGTNAQIMIEIDGSCAACSGSGFTVNADNVVIRGLAIYGFSDGPAVFSAASSNAEPDGLRIEGNFIGTDSGGTADKGNSGGIAIQSSSVGTTNVTVGGAAPEARNLISGNNGAAIDFRDVRDSDVQGNLIGTKKDGTSLLPNTGIGVSFARNSSFNVANNLIGGPTVGSANVIAHNLGEGVNICGGAGTNPLYTQAQVQRNSIFDNFEGIELCLTFPNDPGDVDDGSNGGQNRPVITSAKTSRRATTIKVTLDSTASQGYAFEFFSNPAVLSGSPTYSPDEGKEFKAERGVFTDGDNNQVDTFVFKFKRTEKIRAGQFVTATATRTETGDTSEFSQPVRVKRQ